MIEIDDKLVSLDLFEKHFVCDLQVCKGACCVHGDAGAPLKEDEIDVIEKNIDAIKKNMRKEGRQAIDENGVFYIDEDNEPVTTLVNKEECAFVYFDDNKIAKCAIEKTFEDSDQDFIKPISCHLYPIRVSKLKSYEAINYHHWYICQPACDCGDKLKVKVFRFLKKAITRMWGLDFYNELEVVDKELKKINKKNEI
tara:strand:- start:67 stop:657 length:591 start_codon:yes stop_codon:yes gene_type:complete